MGQYHAVACLDLGEGLYSHPMGQGLKLMEQGSGGFGGTTTGFALFVAPGGRWHGKRVAILGDYAEVGDLPDGVPFAEDPGKLYELATHADGGNVATEFAMKLCGEAFGVGYEGQQGWDDTMFDYARMAEVIANVEDDRMFGPLYVVDLDTQQYLDPHGFGCGRNLPAIALRNGGVMLATFCLLAVSNGRGGGDLHSESELVGSWGAHRIVLGPKPDDGVDLTLQIRAVLDEAHERSDEWHGSWDVLGSVPNWLTEKASDQGVSA